MKTIRRLRLAATVAVLLVSAPALAETLFFADGFESGELDAWSPDEMQLRALIAGAPPNSAQVIAALETIGRSFGLPIRSWTGTFLFAADCGTETFELAGDFNSWQAEPMTENGALCWLERTVVAPVEAQYLLEDEAQALVPDPHARRFVYDVDGEVGLVRSSVAHLERWFGFGPEEGLLKRQIHVWVPAGRVFDRILYLQDGQNLFDPDAFFGGWKLQESLPAGVLAVGIQNTVDRFSEYTHVTDDFGSGPVGGGGDVYADLVHQTIRPFVEARYGKSSRHGLLGSSLGGVISLHIANRFPGQYVFAASMSGTLGWGSLGAGITNETILERYVDDGHGSTTIYLDSGGGGSCLDSDADGIEDDGDDSDNYCVTLQMKDELVGVGYVLDDDLFYHFESGAFSNEEAWAARVDIPLGIFAGL